MELARTPCRVPESESLAPSQSPARISGRRADQRENAALTETDFGSRDPTSERTTATSPSDSTATRRPCKP